MKEAGAKTRAVELPFGFHEVLRSLCSEVAPVARRLGLQVYLVGGAVRDLLEGRDFSGEWDLVVFGGGDEGAKALAREVSRARGGREPVSFPRFGTNLLPGSRYLIEFAQAHLRSNIPSLSSDPLTSDALSRDFTINSLYMEIAGSKPPSVLEISDPGGRGLADLDSRLLRTPVPARMTFEDDPLRIFRAARLCACSSYRIDPSMGRAARALFARIPTAEAACSGKVYVGMPTR